MIGRPAPDEYAAFYETYVRLVQDCDIRDELARQGDETFAFYRGITEAQSRFSYEPGKWSIRQLLGHVCDAERVFSYRALAFARGEEHPLPGFDQDVYVAAANADARPWSSLIDEIAAVRSATVALFRSLDDEALVRRGVASGKTISVRALGFVIAGHERHHLGVLKDRYLGQGTGR